MTQEYRVYRLPVPQRHPPMKAGAQADLALRLGQIDGKLDQLLDLKLDKRIGAVEAWQSRVGGGGAVILFLVSAWELLRYVHVLR